VRLLAGALRLGERALRGERSFGRGVGSLCRERCRERERRSRLLEEEEDEEDDEDDGVRRLFLRLWRGGGDSSTQSAVPVVEGAGVAGTNSV